MRLHMYRQDFGPFAPPARRTVLAMLALVPAASMLSDPVFAQVLDIEHAMTERVLGDESAAITIVEYISLTCPHCARFHADVLPRLKAEFIDTGVAKFISRDFPLDGISLRAAMLARCVDHSQYFGVVDTLLAEQSGWARSSDPVAALATIGQLAGLSRPDAEACMNNEPLALEILEQRQNGIDQYGVSVTPSIYVNGVKVDASLGMIRSKIQSLS